LRKDKVNAVSTRGKGKLKGSFVRVEARELLKERAFVG